MRHIHPAHSALATAILGACTLGTALAADPLQQLRQELAACAVITGVDGRVACYDRLAARNTIAPTAPPVTAAAPAAPSDSPADFGLSGVQKQSPKQRVQALTARIVGFSRASSGRTRVTLDNGETWEMQDDPDALLAVGDSVTIQRATLGSFLLVTPTKLSHRVRRIS